jgi:hypothetical protein
MDKASPSEGSRGPDGPPPAGEAETGEGAVSRRRWLAGLLLWAWLAPAAAVIVLTLGISALDLRLLDFARAQVEIPAESAGPLEEIIARRGIEAVVLMGSNGPPAPLGPRPKSAAERKGRSVASAALDGDVMVLVAALERPPDDRVRIGDVRCCRELAGAVVFDAAIFDERLTLADGDAAKTGESGAAAPQQQQQEQLQQQLVIPPFADSDGGQFDRSRLIVNGTVRAALIAALRQGHTKIAVALGPDFEPLARRFFGGPINYVPPPLTAIEEAACAKRLGPRFVRIDLTGGLAQGLLGVTASPISCRWLADGLLTRLPFAGEAGFGEAAPLADSVATIAADPLRAFNPAIAGQPRTTWYPGAAAVLLWGLGLFVLAPRLAGRSTLASRWPLILGGYFAASGLIILLIALGEISLWLPASFLATLPGLTGLGMLAGACVAFVHVLGLGGFRRVVAAAMASLGKLVRHAVHADTPIRSLAQDRLRFDEVVRSLVEFIDAPDTRPPLVIAVNGPWGSGKSSVMYMLDSELAKKGGRYRSVWFNAWQYAQEEQMLAALLETMCKSLSKGHGPALRFRWNLARENFAKAGLLEKTLLFLPVAIVLWLAIDQSLGPALQRMVQLAVGDVPFEEWGLSDVLKGGTGVAAVAYLGWAARIFFPFRLKFQKLLATKSFAEKIGFIDEFASEFNLYRRAIPEVEKFVVYIDDLDRCPPDKVVDALKAINLIVNSGEGASQTIFVIGFDQEYVLDCVELHFEDFTRRIEARRRHGDEGFGPRYLKKMINLSVSVPMPSHRQILAMLEAMETTPPPVEEPATEWRALLRWSTWRRLLPKLAAAVGRASPQVLGFLFPMMLAAAVVSSAVWLIPPTPAPVPGPGRPETPAVPSPAPPVDREGAGTAPAMIAMPALVPPAIPAVPWTAWALLMLSAVGPVGIFAFIRKRPEAPPAKPPVAEQGRFLDDLRTCRDVLPRNPRDVVRLLNSIGVGFRIEEQRHDGTPPLTVREYVTFAAIHSRFPTLFDPDFVEATLQPELHNLAAGPPISLQERYGLLRLIHPEGRNLAEALEMLRQSYGSDDAIGHFFDVRKVARFVDVNRFVLEVGADPSGLAEGS